MVITDVQRRKKIVDIYRKLHSLRATAAKTGVNVKTVKKWVDRYKEGGVKALADKRFKMPPPARRRKK
ncbi:MAG: helix-turn-helix domain-containing protein [Candidatus Kryptoniota bacterium]